jgi:hypothetical protein
MKHIIKELTDFYIDTNEYPTHLLITQADYDKIMLDNGVITHGKVPFKLIYGAEVIIADCPIEPKFLKLTCKIK